MKEWNGKLQLYKEYLLDAWCKPEEALLFDIETTGFSAKNTMLYMIGFCYIQDGNWNYRILFNDDGRSEHAILTEFLQVLTGYRTLIHYNGDGFDLPYLTEKCQQYHSLGLTLPNSETLNNCTSLDLYKIIKPYRSGLSLPDLKLPTIEQALGFTRTDKYNGGELIRIYHDYLKHPTNISEQQLFQHNYEDILAMIPLLSLLNFKALQSHAWKITEVLPKEDQLLLQLELTHPLPLRYLLTTPYFCFNGCQKAAIVTIPYIKEELKYYLPNWKDYYYLPLEDKVIHKSIAAYVDSSCKEKAKKTTAYIKKEGCFFAIPSNFTDTSIHLYKRNYSDSQSYVDLSELEYTNPEFWITFLEQTF